VLLHLGVRICREGISTLTIGIDDIVNILAVINESRICLDAVSLERQELVFRQSAFCQEPQQRIDCLNSKRQAKRMPILSYTLHLIRSSLRQEIR